MLQVRPATAKPFPFSFVTAISLVAFLEITMPKMPRINPTSGIKIDRIPKIKETIDLLFVSVFTFTFLPPNCFKMARLMNGRFIYSTRRCLERKTDDSGGISVCLETPQRAFFATEEAQATPLGKRSAWSAKQQFAY